MQLNPQIFRANDIRGVADTDLNDEVVIAVGRAYGTMVRRAGGTRATLGRDHRPSSARIFAGLAKGMLAAGVDVVDLGLVPTPVLYFSKFHLGITSGIMVTGSHLPPEENGFKMVLAGEMLADQKMHILQKLVDAGDVETGDGRVTAADIVPAYIETVAKLCELSRPLKVVVDSGNGMGGIIAPEIFRRIGANVIELFSALDPTFPNHFPDPTIPANMVALQEKVVETGADLGVAFDADCDRLGVVDGQGRLIWGDTMLALFFREIASKHQRAPVIVEVKCSQATFEDIAAHGGVPFLWKTGHAFIKAKMQETKAVIAGEMSGHLFFGDEYFPYDDGIYAGARMARLVSKSELPLDQLVDEIPSYVATPELRVYCADETKFAVVDAVRDDLLAKYPESFTLDGIRVAFPDGWALVRCSNTSPRIIVRAEGKDASSRDANLQVVRDALATHEGVDVSALDQCLRGEEVTSH